MIKIKENVTYDNLPYMDEDSIQRSWTNDEEYLNLIGEFDYNKWEEKIQNKLNNLYDNINKLSKYFELIKSDITDRGDLDKENRVEEYKNNGYLLDGMLFLRDAAKFERDIDKININIDRNWDDFYEYYN